MALLFFTIFNSILGLSMLFPILGPLGRDLGLSEVQIGSLSTAYSLVQMAFATRWGRASTTHGRKRILLIGVLGFVLGFALLGIAVELGRSRVLEGGPLFFSMLVARLIGGTFSSAMLPTAQAYAADLTGSEDRTRGMAVIGAAFGLSIVFGPLLGLSVAYVGGLSAPIWCAAILGLFNAFFAAMLLAEPRSQTGQTQAPRAVKTLLRASIGLLAISAAITTASVIMEQTIAFAIEDRLRLTHEEAPRWVGGALAAYGLVAVAVQGGLIRRARVHPRVWVVVGVPISVVGLLVLAGSDSYGGILLGMALTGLGQGLVLPGITSTLSLSVADAEQGTIAGLSSTAQGVGRLIGPTLGAGLYQLAPQWPYLLSAAISFGSLIMWIAVVRRGESS